MSKFCKKCGKEIPLSSKADTCENCQNKKYGFIRKVGEVTLGIATAVVVIVITKGKSGTPKV